MANAFNLFGTLRLNVAEFSNNLKKSGKGVRKFAVTIKKRLNAVKNDFLKATEGIRKFGVGLKSLAQRAAVFSAAMLAATKVALDSVAALDGMARSTGTSAEKIQELSLAFNRLGLDSADVSDVLNTLADRSQDALDGMQSFIDDFGLVGIEVDNLKNKDPGQLFDLFADAVQRTQDPVKRQAAIVRILGDDLGRRLAPALLSGSGAFKELGDQARASGAILDNDLVSLAADASKSVNELVQIIKSGLLKIFAQLGPFITVAAQELKDFVAQGDFFKTGVTDKLVTVLKVIGVLGDGLRIIKVAFKGATVIAKGFGVGVLGFLKSIVDTLVIVGNTIKNFLIDPLIVVTKAALEATGQFKGVVKVLKEVEKFKFEVPTLAIDSMETAMVELRDATQGFLEELSSERPSDAIDRFLAKVQNLRKQVSDKGKGVNLVDNSANDKALAQAKEDFIKFSQEINATFEGAISAAFDGEFDKIDDMFKALLKRMVAQALAADLSRALKLNLGTVGTGENIQPFRTGAESFFSGGAQALKKVFGFFGGSSGTGSAAASVTGAVQGAASSTTANTITNTFNISAKDAVSFKAARGRLTEAVARASRTS